jgi:hypothetical protein
MPFDWIAPNIYCRVILPTSPDINTTTRWFHRRVVAIDKLDCVWDTNGKEVNIALVRVEQKQLWADYGWLEPLSASSVCICPLKRILLQGCKCGGV